MEDTNAMIPDWTLEDFMTQAPYEWLYERRENKFTLQLLLNRTLNRAKSLHFQGFMKTWNSFVKQNSPQTSILGSNQTMFPGQPVQLGCGSYVADEYGVSRINEMGAEVEVISHPIMPVMRLVNIETLEAKLSIAFQRGEDPWKTITVPRELLASAQKIIALAKQDIGVNSENAKEVVKFLSALESINYDELQKQNAVSHMGWLSDGRFMPYVDDVTYDGENAEFDRVYRELKPTGDEQAWMDLAKDVRAGNSVPARIALAAGFAAPLVKKLDALPFFVHLWGEKGCGKTVGLMLAASVWGNPELGGLAKTFSGTKVSFELSAAFCCNLPVLLDELQVVNDNRKNFDDIIYMLCEGVSKGRGSRDGGLQLQRRWSTCIITTGETPIIQSNSGGGAAVRTIEVNYKGQPLFGTDSKARDAASTLKKNYGFAGKKFIEVIQREGMVDALRKIFQKYYDELSGEIDAKQIISASILLAADALATTFIFKDGHNLTADELKEFLITKDESNVNLRCYQFITDWIAQNPRRFDTSDMNSGECWGSIENGVAYINRTVFETTLQNKGYSLKPFLNWAKDTGKLLYEDHGSGSERRLTVRKSFPSGRMRCFAIDISNKPPMTPEQMEYTKLSEEEVPSEMPF